MKQLRELVADLVQRRLWPVALALVVALVAVPVLLGRGDAQAPTAAVPGADAGGSAAKGEKAEVTLDTSMPAERPTAKKVRDPFKLPVVHVAKTTTPAASPSPSAAPASPAASTSPGGASPTAPPSTGASTGSSSTGSSSTDSSSTGSTSTGTTKPKTTTTTPKTTAPTADDVSDTYHVSLRVSVDGGKVTTIRDIARLSPLPSVTDPFFVYLGVLQTKGDKPEKRAVFVVSSDATPNGEGACHPTKEDCETVELTVGQTVFFDVADPNGGPGKQYQLELAGIHKTEVKAEAKAAAAFARHSVAGAELLRDAATRNVRSAGGARAYRYLPAVGLLVRAKRAKVTAKAAAAGEIPGIELVDRKHQPGLPVWHSPKK